MALVLKTLYKSSDSFEEYHDPRMINYTLLGSPVPVLIVIGLYLLFVLKVGPEWMKDRKPFNLKRVISVYNAIQVVANLMLFIISLKSSYLRKDFSVACQPINHSVNDAHMSLLLKATYGYYLLKYLDLLDTVFFVLRKKNEQITFLHVYHHAGMTFATYIFTKFLAGSHPTMLGVINSAVHAVMYSYYFVTSYKPHLKNQIWWKKQITRLQLLQFGYLVIHFIMPTIRNPCNFPVELTFIGVIQNLFMFLLFFDFYLKAYCKKKPVNSMKDNKVF